ncbi:4Fe-4S cluster-binding domain-containing protein [Neglecta sp. X4]|uniref:radical SAM protein n=1 Tax=unclassified Neglectibacter TaxID=2632164 RepID=UPI00136E22A1|nr:MULTISPECIES: radical SAM protein [unclassified Neglectibacter]NBI18937.1 4Fe-4S cluster-binding domain-containing protein [Neglectibacter sp. 59]NBJ74649.1 4Fe-4S cluster-binding domain-containing protein [Neglectibacter sp. X4]NCE82286.1 4Fe-4S cluster-binding domain-containing protein [Neglectibacter sp. X58]
MEKPHILLIKTALGKYFYEVGRNEIVAIQDDLFALLSTVMKTGVQPEQDGREVTTQYYNLVECGYLQPCVIEEIRHPLTDELHCMLERKIEKITLQVTQSCNLRCTYCIYSETGNFSQRSHSSLQMSFETAKRALDFCRAHSEDTTKIHIGFYGGEPLLSFPIIRQIIAYSEKIFSGKLISYDMIGQVTYPFWAQNLKPSDLVYRINNFISRMSEEKHPDVVLIRLPLPTIKYDSNNPFDFGIISFIVSQAVHGDGCICCAPS